MDTRLDDVEKLPVGVVISIAFHAVVVAWAVGYEPPPRGRVVDRPNVPIELVVKAPEPEAVQVALLDEGVQDAALVAPDPIVPARPVRRQQAIALGSTRAVIEQPGTIEQPGVIGPRNPLFDMRSIRQRPADLQLRREFRDSLDHAPKGTVPTAPVEPTGQLRPSGGGTYRSDEGVFTARVSKDGSVKLKDSKNLRFKFPNPLKIPAAVGRHVADWAASDNKIPNDPEQVALNNNRAPDKDTRPDHGDASVPIVGGGFDITDALMRRKKIDPYASRKLKYLDSTRDERVQIGNKYRAQQLKQSAELMQRNLDYLWSSFPDPAARKQGLFELWDDCAETGPTSIVEGGRAARSLVVGFIRAKLPAGSEHAFSVGELATFNRGRQSTATFAPYE